MAHTLWSRCWKLVAMGAWLVTVPARGAEVPARGAEVPARGAEVPARGAEVPARGAEVFDVAIDNPSFATGAGSNGVPRGWARYGRGKSELKIVDRSGGEKALLIADHDLAAEAGVTQAVRLKGSVTYRATVKVRAVEGESTAGAYLQMRFLPSNQFLQVPLIATSAQDFSEVAILGTAPPDTEKGVIYLYTHRGPTPSVIVTDVRLQGGLPPPPPPPAPPPPPVPPQYDKLKNLHLDIPLIRNGTPQAVIVVPALGRYPAAATIIQEAIEKRTGVKLPIVGADAPQAVVPIRGNLIVLGNRSTNKTINALYDLYYCLVDLKYPGPGGYVIRSLHNPFANGHGVVIVGGSDDAGVDEGARALVDIFAKAPAAKGQMSIGWTMTTKLGRGIKAPTKIKEFETWEASKGYGSVGYFGWCSISKRMAMYYMTGDEFSAREVVRLAFPDQGAIKEIEQIDGEQIENKHDPLAGFYHYNAHLAILLWDLIEESPLFTDAERLKITNAFARQLNHRKAEGVYGLTRAPAHVGSRHGQWSAIALYCLGRYFDKDYPSPVWTQCIRGSTRAFQSLHEHPWVAGENDNLFWYNTAIAPVLTYMVLTGDRKPLENGVLGVLLRGQEILVSGRVPDWALRSAAMSFLNQAAYLTGDGRWIEYRRRTEVDTDVFRLGQSFWPDETLPAKPPADLAGKWSVLALPKPHWQTRGSGLPFAQSFFAASYRSTADAGGDYILLDGFNGASRNPYHTFEILELRLAGQTILQGYHNQVLTSADGMVEPAVAMDAALRFRDVIGPTVVAVGEVPKAAFCNWRRSLVDRTGRYALVVDDLTFRTDSSNMKVSTTWQVTAGGWDRKSQAVHIPPASAKSSPGYEIRSCDVQQAAGRGVVTMVWSGAVKPGEHRRAFYWIKPAGTGPATTEECVRVAENAAAIARPQPVLAVVGEYAQVNGELVVMAHDHLFGHAFTRAGIDDVLASSDSPIDLDWDFTSGAVTVVVETPTTVRLSLRQPNSLQLDDKPATVRKEGGADCLPLSRGRHTLVGAFPAAENLAALTPALQRLLADGRKSPIAPSAGSQVPANVAELPAVFTSQLGGKAVEMIATSSSDTARLAIAVGNSIHLLTHDGREVRRLQTDGNIRVLRWWGACKLLLAGCVDEKVVAFDAMGQRKWVFVSEMDPAVYEAAKNYWFKTAPGHEGIHGLGTGAFDDGKQRCFVGSACTLEILDDGGRLVKRTPVFWGPVWKFLLIAGREGSPTLLASQWPNGGDDLAIIGSKTLAVEGRGYVAVPEGHSYVGGWTAQNRTGLFYEDLDGDGRKEVVTAVNGIWNRVTVYSEDGHPRWNAQFGAGPSNTPYARMRAMDLADLNADGKQEIVVGIAEGLVVALTHQCQRLWSTRLPSPPVTLRCIPPKGEKQPWVVAGCEDGTVAALDCKGALVRLGKITGRPTHIQTIALPEGPLVVLATDRGEIKGFKIGD